VRRFVPARLHSSISTSWPRFGLEDNHVCFVPKGPARLIPAACSDAPIFTDAPAFGDQPEEELTYEGASKALR